MAKEVDLLKTGLQMTKKAGLTLGKRNWLTLLYLMFNITILLAVLTLNLVGIYVYSTNLFFVADALQYFFILSFVLQKTILQIIKKQDIEELLERSKLFWPIDPKDKDCTRTIKIFDSFNKFYCYSVCFAGAIYCITPIITRNKKETPFKAYIPYDLHAFVTVLQWYGCAFIVLSGAGFDILFSSFCGQALIQFKLLCKAISETKLTGNTIDSKKWNSFAAHHDFLINYSKKLNELGSLPMLMQFATTTISCSMEMYVILSSNGKLTVIIKSILYCICSFTELSFYTFPTQYLSDEALKVADALYETDWYEAKSSNIKNHLLFMIRAAQKKITFSASGFVVFNLQTFVTIFKSTMSFYTLMKTVDEKNS